MGRITVAYNKHIDKTEEALSELRVAYNHKGVDCFLDGLVSGHINTEEKVRKFINYIRESDGLTTLEYTRLKKMHDEGYLEQFATNYNKRLSTAKRFATLFKNEMCFSPPKTKRDLKSNLSAKKQRLKHLKTDSKAA